MLRHYETNGDTSHRPMRPADRKSEPMPIEKPPPEPIPPMYRVEQKVKLFTLTHMLTTPTSNEQRMTKKKRNA